MLALPSTKLHIPACWSVTSVQEGTPFLCTKQMPWFYSKEGKMAIAVRGCRGKSWQHKTTQVGNMLYLSLFYAFVMELSCAVRIPAAEVLYKCVSR